jgi:hypothetical protein
MTPKFVDTLVADLHYILNELPKESLMENLVIYINKRDHQIKVNSQGQILEFIKEVYDDDYQDRCAEEGIKRKTPQTLFHNIIDTQLNGLNKLNENLQKES